MAEDQTNGSQQQSANGDGDGDRPQRLTDQLPVAQLRHELGELAKMKGRQMLHSLLSSRAGGAADKAGGAAGKAGDLAGRAKDRVREEAKDKAGAVTQRAASGAGDLAQEAVGGAKQALGADGGGAQGIAKAVGGKAVQAVTGQGGGGGGGGGSGSGGKVTNIVEEIDVGVPVRVAYDQWTQFTEFPSFMRKVEDVQEESDTELRWRGRVLWSSREWKSEILEQIPDERLVWRSEGSKGRVDGAVSFHEIGPNLTKILLVLEYYPQGLFEKTGNIWRAQGRRARLELKHFRRHVMTQTVLHPDEVEGRRAVIHEGEVQESSAAEEPDEQQGQQEQPDEQQQGQQDEQQQAHADA